nr:hypothetical protein [Tanacetum cinerariifolium]
MKPVIGLFNIISFHSHNPKFLLHFLDFSCWVVLGHQHGFHIGLGDLICISEPQNVHIPIPPGAITPPALAGPDPLVFSSHLRLRVTQEVVVWESLVPHMEKLDEIHLYLHPDLPHHQPSSLKPTLVLLQGPFQNLPQDPPKDPP